MDLLILVLTCIINLILGLFVLLRDTRKAYARLFASISVWLIVWIASNFLTNHHVLSLDLTRLANSLTYVSGFAVLLSALLFTNYFPVKRRVPRYEAFFVAALALVITGLSFTEGIAGEVSIGSHGELLFSVGSLVWLYVVGFVLVLTLMTRNLLTVSKRKSIVKVRQARLILLAFGSTALLGLLFNVIIPVIVGNWESTRYGPLVTLILVTTIAYTIVKHGLFDIRFAVVRGVAYVFSVITLAGFYYLVVYAVSQSVFLGQQGAVSQSPVSIGLALLVAFIFQPVKHFFDRITNSVFYKGNYSVDDFIARFSRKLTTASDLGDLLRHAAEDIASTLRVEQAFFFVSYSGNRSVTSGTVGHRQISVSDIKVLEDFFKNIKDELIVIDTISDESDSKLYRLLARHKIGVVLPLWHGGNLTGYLFLGEKRVSYYVERDLRALQTIRDELAIAIQNALSVQEVKDINATLQERIDEATSELRANNALLQRLDEAKDEFISMASHQLRTPLTSVKGYISMVLEGDAGKISRPQRHLLNEAFASSERMVHLINDFLNVSRLQTGKFMLEQRPIDLAKITTEEVEGLRSIARVHGLTLQYRPPARFPLMYIDESKVRQVIMNFIDNAIYYSHEGTSIKISLAVTDGNAVLEVSDTGIGVPAKEQSHLFTKFFRATNARRQRPDGTGVGLFLSKKVVAAHGGTMVFQSTEGKGSTFGFRLPVKKLSVAPADESKKLN